MYVIVGTIMSLISYAYHSRQTVPSRAANSRLHLSTSANSATIRHSPNYLLRGYSLEFGFVLTYIRCAEIGNARNDGKNITETTSPEFYKPEFLKTKTDLKNLTDIPSCGVWDVCFFPGCC